MNRWQLKNRIVGRLRRMRDELRQLVDDQESWNDNCPEHPPFDVGADKSLLYYVTKQLEAWEVDDMDSINAWNAKMVDLANAIEFDDDAHA